MKKIYEVIIINIETGEKEYEESYFYDGSVSLCKGDVNVPPPPPKSATELETEKVYLQILKDMQAGTGQYAPSELDKLTEQYGEVAIKSYIEGLPMEKEYREKSLQLLTQNLEYQAIQLQRLSDMQQLGEITGDLTAEEKTMFQTMADTAKQKIADAVNREQTDIMEEAVASLVDRGVLQGGVGVQVLSKIGERAQELIAQGASDVETQKLANMLNTIESNKNRAIQWAGLGMTQQQIISGVGQAGYAAASQPMITAAGIQQYGAGLREAYGKDVLGGYSTWLNTQAAERGTQYQGALQAAIASSKSQAGMFGAGMGALGNIAGMGAMGLMMKSSKEFKEKIKKLTKTQRIEILEAIRNMRLYKWKYKKQFKDLKDDHIGLVTEEAPDFLVTDDKKHIDIINYLAALTASIQVLEART